MTARTCDAYPATTFSREAPRGRPFLRAALLAVAHRGLFVPTSAAAVTSTYSLLATGRVSGSLALATFLFVYASYRLDHLAEVGKLDDAMASERSRALRARRGHAALAIAAFAGALLLSVRAGLGATLVLLSFPLSVACYGTPLLSWLSLGRSSVARLKDIPYFKSFYTAFFWGLLAVYGHAFLHVEQAAPTVMFFGWMVGRGFVNVVYCDIKDLDRDRLEGVRTIALRFGVQDTLLLLSAINVAVVAGLGLSVAAGALPRWALPLAIGGLYVEAFLQAARRPGADRTFLCEVVADCEFALWLPLALLGRSLLPV